MSARPAALSVTDYADRARAVLGREAWDWLEGGAGQERTLAANRAALDRVSVVPRVLADVASCDSGALLLGRPARLPVAVAPVAYQRLFHPDGESAAARAAAAAGIPFVVSTLTSTPLAELAATGAELWFQLYWPKDEALLLRLVRGAEEAGCKALVLTVDVPFMGRRLRDVRHGFALPQGVRAALLDDPGAGAAHRRTAHASAVAAHTAEVFSASVGWSDLARLRRVTDLPLVVKGVLDPGDAVRAAEAGAAAVVVSNHGGRQLDGAVPSAAALPAVVRRLRAAGSEHCQVFADSGVRSGSDVLAMLALGASGVLLGRPLVWGLAADGEAGCADVLRLLGEEFRHAMALAGCPDLAAVAGLRTAADACSCGGRPW
ncbi:alpha-hydroxy acid oxidase [Kitasatospora sp. NPDC052868]|uniref:alpha-hydroxy acid oxidase n=1 Tax=Kitasatospora sp. NPDC052868 TaxID=3364060 RepID=UPI0037C78940